MVSSTANLWSLSTEQDPHTNLTWGPNLSSAWMGRAVGSSFALLLFDMSINLVNLKSRLAGLGGLQSH